MPTAHSKFTTEPTNPLQEAEARAKLIQALSSSLEVSDVISYFFTHLQALLAIEGLRYISPDDRDEYLEGKVCKHHCNYRLTSDDNYLGEIVFGRNRRFSDGDMLHLETLLGLLVCPLRNALRYQWAMAQALRDSLTGTGNRAALDHALRRELQLSERHQTPLSLLVIDIDHFKRINDEFGHGRGDTVLKEMARMIAQACRTTDMVFRYGGEEFVVLLSNTDAEGAYTIAERLRSSISEQPIALGSEHKAMTVSIGISTRPSGEQSHVDDLFERADRALYRAKAKGRNCVVCALPPAEEQWATS